MGNWATLSYCWGQVGGYVTNVANLDCRTRSISMQVLQATLKDAIKVTGCMGLKYLWIDSIWILQGSDVAAQANWLSEASRRRDYYKHCDFCIAADDASSDQIGVQRILRTQRANVSISMPLAHWRRAGSCTIYLQADVNPHTPVGVDPFSLLEDGRFKNTFSLHALYTSIMNNLSGIASFRNSQNRMWIRKSCRQAIDRGMVWTPKDFP